MSRDAQFLTTGLALIVAGAIVFSTCWTAPLHSIEVFHYRCGACTSLNEKERRQWVYRCLKCRRVTLFTDWLFANLEPE